MVDEAPEISVFALGAILLRRRRWIIALTVLGAVIGLLSGLLRSRQYAAGTVFIPQASETPNNGLALAASQFGIRLPNAGSTWGPPVYVELLNSWAVLDTIAQDTISVSEEGGRRIPLMTLLNATGATAPLRTENAVRALRRIVSATEDKKLNAVRLSVVTRWPSVSLALAQHLVREVDRFDLQTRRSQAGAERQFVEQQANDAEAALRHAEDRLQEFLQTNRVAASPQLDFQRERLQRDITMQQQVYTTLVQSREEARMREVRDIPTITVLEPPRLPVIPEARNSVLKGIVGGILGALIGLILAFTAHGLAGAKAAPTGDSSEFFELVNQIKPRFRARRHSQ